MVMARCIYRQAKQFSTVSIFLVGIRLKPYVLLQPGTIMERYNYTLLSVVYGHAIQGTAQEGR
jgi:hypothetical protein